MKKNYGKMLLGMLIGILGALTLTLNIWGDEWYKIITSTFAGVVVGIFVTDYKTSLEVFKSVGQSFLRFISVSTDNDLKEKRKLLFFRWVYAIILLFFAISLIAISVLWSFGSDTNNNVPNFFILVPSIVFTSAFCLDVTGALDFDIHRKNIPDKFYEVWGLNVPEKFKDAIKGLSYQRVFKNCFKLGIFFMAYFLIRQLKWLVKSFFPGMFAILIALLLTIPWLVRAIGRYGHLSFVSLVIVAGALLGTLTHSWLYGLIVVPISLVLNYTFSNVEVKPAWFFKKYNFEEYPSFAQ